MDRWEKEHVKHVAKYEAEIRRIYEQAMAEAARIMSMATFDASKPLSFSDYPLIQTLITKLQRKMAASVEAVITKGIDAEWDLSAEKTRELVESLFGDLDNELMELRTQAYLLRRDKAREAFKMRKERGLSLSDRVWQYTGQFKEELEMALDLGLRDGKSADELSREVRKYLNNPNMLFRRVRDEHGVLHLSKRAKAYHPGQGVYRSSYKNARRLTATETNMAYRSADFEHRQALDFIVGIKIQLSNNHTLNGEPFVDICDHLMGEYPRDFKFVGWHPLCRCIVTNILKTKEERREDRMRILRGEAPIPPEQSKNYVGDTPDQFKAWCALNAGRVERAKSLPYFIRDNKGYYDAALNPKKAEELTPLEIAKYRHEQRTPEQIESIKNRWHVRQEKYRRIELAANNVLKVAKDYGEVDYTLLQQYVDAHDLKGMASVTRTTAQEVLAMKQAEAKLATLIPDAHKWHKQYTIAELQQVYDAVEKKMATIKGLPLEQQLKKLEFEMQYVADPTKYKPGATKYPTWKVSQDAYGKQYEDVLEAIEWQNIKNALFDAQTFKTKSPQYKALLNDLEDAVLQKKKGTAQIALAELQAKRHSLEMSMARRAAKRQSGTIFSEDAFTQDRKDNALWFKDVRNKQHALDDADREMSKYAEENWTIWTNEEKHTAWLYTSGSRYINEPLFAKYYGTKTSSYDGSTRDSWSDINRLTTMIDKSKPMQKDMWVVHGEDMAAFRGQFGVSLSGMDDKALQSLVGRTMTNTPFTSCGCAYGGGFSSEAVIMNIYCPKGTKFIYTEPYSFYGDGMYREDGMRWNGKSRLLQGYSCSTENEIILQRGSQFRVTKVEKKNGRFYIDMELIAQPAKTPNVI